MRVVLSESQFNRLILEYYDRDRLYPKDQIIDSLKGAPKYLKKYIDNLPSIPCENSEGVKKICTKIPEVLYVYLKGNF